MCLMDLSGGVSTSQTLIQVLMDVIDETKSYGRWMHMT